MRLPLTLFLLFLSPLSFASDKDTLNKRFENFTLERDLIILEAFGLTKAHEARKSGKSWREIGNIALREIEGGTDKGTIRFDFSRFEKDLREYLTKAKPGEDISDQIKRIASLERLRYKFIALGSIRSSAEQVFLPGGRPTIISVHTVGEFKRFEPALNFFQKSTPKRDLSKTQLVIYKPERSNTQYANFVSPGPDRIDIPATIPPIGEDKKGARSLVSFTGANKLSAKMNKHFYGTENVIMMQEVLFKSGNEPLTLGVITEELSHYYDYLNDPKALLPVAQLEESAKLAKQYEAEGRKLVGEIKEFFKTDTYKKWKETNLKRVLAKFPNVDKDVISTRLDNQYGTWAVQTFKERYIYYFSKLESQGKARACAVLHQRYNYKGDKIIDILFVQANELAPQAPEALQTAMPQPPFMERYFDMLLKKAGVER